MSDQNIKKLFKDKDLLKEALTHKSWVNENPNSRRSNERLEFLGDAILEFVVSDYIFKKFPKREEGYLTALRASLVNTKNLSVVAERLDIGDKMFLSKGEEEGRGRENPSLLADTMEAVIGGLYFDQGLEAVTEFIVDEILKDLEEKISQPLKDSKSRLQEHVQAQGKSAPKYKVVNEEGPDHDKKFEVEVRVEGKTLAKGYGKSKSEAAQLAATEALNNILDNK